MGLSFIDQLQWSPNPCRHCTPEEDYRTRFSKGPGCYKCNGSGYGPQLNILLAGEDEVFVGGPKGWGKSAACQIWLLSGNPYSPDGPLHRVRVRSKGSPDRVIITGGPDYSYVYQPEYLALVTRKSEDDLLSWINVFKPLAERMGGRFVGRPDYQFKFPDQNGVVDAGGTIMLSHFRDTASYEKVQGLPQLHRWQPEEVSQLKDEAIYESVSTSLRTTNSKLRTQIMPTANPEGPGIGWVAKRFVDIKDSSGSPIPPNTQISVVTREPLTGSEVTRTKIYITGNLLDNPRINQQEYIATINAIADPRKRRALLLGDWSAAIGDFFPEFRELQFEGEPANACHVYHPQEVELQPWWRRGIGLDWGYSGHKAAVLFGCEDPRTGRMFLENELTFQNTGARKLGAIVAKEALPLLERHPTKTIPIWLSHDAFGKRNEEEGVTRIATLIKMGIQSVIGPSAVSSPTLEICEMADSEGLEYTEFIQRYAEIQRSVDAKKRYGLVIYRAPMANQASWALLHEMLRWDFDLAKEVPEFDWKTWQRLGRDINAQAAVEYARQFEPVVTTRPELQISTACRELIKGFRNARTHDKHPDRITDKHFEGRDSLDACAYLLSGMAFSKRSEEVPYEELRARRVHEFRQANPDSGPGALHQAAEYWDSQGLDRKKSSAVFGRLGSSRRPPNSRYTQ